MNKHQAPLYERMLEHRSRRPSSFHVPGHKNGQAMPDAVAGLQALMELDYTEITGLDDLNQPEGVIREAEQLAATCFGAGRTFFLVQGSTLGNMALILSVCDPGDLILVDRFVHKSVLNGLMLANARAVFLSPTWDPRTGYAAGIDEASLQAALNRYPEAKAVFITRPNYYGQAADLTNIVSMTHEAGLPLFVDEAHGAHFGFHEEVPRPALSYGADAVVQSTHKMLSALTMGSMLHVREGYPHIDRIERAIRMLQTSSPSYPVMASLDVARMLMHTQGRQLISQGLQAVRMFERGMAKMPWFMLPTSRGASGTTAVHTTSDRSGTPGGTVHQDPFKQAVRDRTGTLNGYELQELLEREGCMTEMADEQHVLLVFSPFSAIQDSERILKIFRRISTQYQLDKKELSEVLTNIYILPVIPTSTEPVMFSRHMMNHLETTEVPLAEAAGRHSADMIIPYPPGIPFVYPGERLDEQIVESLLKMASKGARFQGGIDSSLAKVRVFVRHPEAHERMT